jgi:hypothetical protein
MLGWEVPGRSMNMAREMGPPAQRISRNDQRHPLEVTANPERRGPIAGPQEAAETFYGLRIGGTHSA